MQRRSSQSKAQLMNFSGFLFSTAWVTSLTAMIFFAFISSFHSSNIWNLYNIHRHIFIFPGYIMNQLNDQLLAGLLGRLSCAYDQDTHSIKCIYTTYKTNSNYRQWVLTLLQQMDSEHEYENLVLWVPLWGSEWMYFWTSQKYSSATTIKMCFHIELKWVTHLQISSHSNTWNLWNALLASMS